MFNIFRMSSIHEACYITGLYYGGILEFWSTFQNKARFSQENETRIDDMLQNVQLCLNNDDYYCAKGMSFIYQYLITIEQDISNCTILSSRVLNDISITNK